jgi:hypothetical protein
VQVERHAQALGALEQHIEGGIVEEASVRMPVDHRAPEAQLGDRALELVGGGLGRRGRQGGEAGEAVGVLGDGARERVVGLARERDRRVGIEVLDPRRRVADDLQVDAGVVHGGQASLAEVGEVGLQRRA